MISKQLLKGFCQQNSNKIQTKFKQNSNKIRTKFEQILSSKFIHYKICITTDNHILAFLIGRSLNGPVFKKFTNDLQLVIQSIDKF